MLSIDDRMDLEAPITLEETKSAIGTTSGDTSPEADVLTIEFYKKFSTPLSELLHEVFRHAREKRIFHLLGG